MSAETIVQREDLSKRTALSKSEVMTRSYCTVQSWYQRIAPLPWKPTPEMVFGSSVDAGVEQVLKAHRAGFPANAKAREAAAEVIIRDEQPVDLDEVMVAVDHFERDVVPQYDWSYVGLQVSLNATFDFGPVNGHPDIILYPNPDNPKPLSLWDLKTAKKAKSPDDLWSKPELAIYAALFERATGERLATVGYHTWARTKEPKWGTLSLDVDDDLIAFGIRELKRQTNLRRQFDAFREVDPSDWFEGPAYPSRCKDCAFREVCTTGKRNVARLGGTTE